jgi:hypothetical protein
MVWKMYAFRKQTQFLQGNNVLDAPAINMDSFLSSDTLFHLVNWIGLQGTYELFSTLKTMIFRKYFFQKLTQISLGNNVVDAAAS